MASHSPYPLLLQPPLARSALSDQRSPSPYVNIPLPPSSPVSWINSDVLFSVYSPYDSVASESPARRRSVGSSHWGHPPRPSRKPFGGKYVRFASADVPPAENRRQTLLAQIRSQTTQIESHLKHLEVSVNPLRTSESLQYQASTAQSSAVRPLLQELLPLLPTATREVDRMISSLDCGIRSEQDTVKDMSDIIQHELDSMQTDFRTRRRLLRVFSRLSDATGDLPPSYYLQDVQRASEPLGSGGFGDVYRGTWGGRDVVVKTLPRFNAKPDPADTYQAAFTRELLTWRQLRHPNVLPLLGADQATAAPRLALITPWMPHGSIRDLMRHTANIADVSKMVPRMLEEIAEGMKYLHSQNVVHGNIRGANVLVDDEHHVLLSDFGLTAFTSPRAFKPNDAGHRVRWAAPELLNGTVARPRFTTDVYSFASTCLEICTNNDPFSDILHDADVSRIVVLGERPAQPTDPSGPYKITESMWALMLACWQDNPSQRPDMAKILKDLKDAPAAGGSEVVTA